jgi:hypothetical protein
MSTPGKSASNIGTTGFDSIRIAGMRVQDLPMVPGAHAKFQLPLFQDSERQNKIEDVLNKFPKQSVMYLKSRITEAEENAKSINALKTQNNQKISEYTSALTLCELRDKQIAAIPDDDPDRDDKIKTIRKNLPPYQVEAMRDQLIQFAEAIQRCDEVIAQEYSSIAELREVMALCEQRDSELRNLGASAR